LKGKRKKEIYTGQKKAVHKFPNLSEKDMLGNRKLRKLKVSSKKKRRNREKQMKK
jgi:hypothetical protein